MGLWAAEGLMDTGKLHVWTAEGLMDMGKLHVWAANLDRGQDQTSFSSPAAYQQAEIVSSAAAEGVE